MAGQQNGTKRHVLASDLRVLRTEPQYADLDLEELTGEDGQVFWRVKIHGANYYKGNVYEMDIQFSRRHPFEPPKLMFPMTANNQRCVRHPLIDADGRLCANKVSVDVWSPILTVSDVINEVRELFAMNPPHANYSAADSSALDALSTELLHRVSLYLPLADICRLSETCRKCLALLHSDQFWATLYYERCNLTNSLLHQMPSPGPLRVISCTGQWHWQDARESFIQAYQCGRYARNVPPFEELVAQELRLLTMVSCPGFVWWGGAPGPRDEVLAAWRYRLRRSARVARWLLGDAAVIDAIHDTSSSLPASTALFLASLLLGGGLNAAEDLAWLQRAAAANDRQLRARVRELEWELDLLRLQTRRFHHPHHANAHFAVGYV